MAARHFTVEGFVQGVGFRWFTQRKASQFNLGGWVRNLPDSSVEVWAEGDENALDLFEESLRTGPPGSSVRRLSVKPSVSTGSYQSFSIKY